MASAFFGCGALQKGHAIMACGAAEGTRFPPVSAAGLLRKGAFFGYVRANMRLYGAKVPQIAQDIVRALLSAKEIETESPKEVQADVEAVLKSYLDAERVVDDKARELLQRTGRGTGEFSRVRASIRIPPLGASGSSRAARLTGAPTAV